MDKFARIIKSNWHRSGRRMDEPWKYLMKGHCRVSLKREISKNWTESSQHFELLIVFHVALLIRPNNHQTLQIGHIFGWNVECSTFILTDLISPVHLCLVSWCAVQFLGPRGPLVLPLVNPPARTTQWKSGHLYTGIYASWIIRRLLKPTHWPYGIP